MEAPTWVCADEGPHLNRLRYEATLARRGVKSKNDYLAVQVTICALVITLCLLAQWAVAL